MTRDEIITKLVTAFGPHVSVVSREPDEDHRHKWTELVPDGQDELGTTMVTEWDPDPDMGAFVRALTYGEIADAIAGERP